VPHQQQNQLVVPAMRDGRISKSPKETFRKSYNVSEIVPFYASLSISQEMMSFPQSFQESHTTACAMVYLS